MRDWQSLIAVALTLRLAVPQSVDRLPHRLLPADEAAQDPALLQVRSELLSAAKRGDLQAVLRLTDPNVQVSWDERRGLFELQRNWRYKENPTGFLTELATVLSLGGRFEDEKRQVFIAPYIWFGFDDTTQMPGAWVAVKSSVRVYAQPRTSSAVIAHLSYDVLTGHRKGIDSHWIEVDLPHKSVGYVQDTEMRNPADTRAYLSKTDAGWRLTGFYAGFD